MMELEFTAKETIVKVAGAKLRQQRELYGMTLEDVQQRTYEQFGKAGMVKYGHLSKIERGMLVKPPNIKVIANLAAVYHMKPEQIMEWYGLSSGESEDMAEPPVITRTKLFLMQLKSDDPKRAELLKLIEFALFYVQQSK
jgi:transcriptional regulator with XRE-family HTH domain